MPDLYLIAHKVRGEPAFDVAEQLPCMVCAPVCEELDVSSPGCHACDHKGYWWIIPTSGHRAYPYWAQSLFACNLHVQNIMDELPLSLRDHYEINREPRETRSTPSGGKPKLTEIDLADLGL